MVKAAVFKKWAKKLQKAAEKMSTMEFLNLQDCSLGQLYSVWQGLHNPLSILKATASAQLLIKRYPLLKALTTGSNKNYLYPIYKQDPETTTHFFIHCRALAETRQPYINKILDGCHSLMV